MKIAQMEARYGRPRMEDVLIVRFDRTACFSTPLHRFEQVQCVRDRSGSAPRSRREMRKEQSTLLGKVVDLRKELRLSAIGKRHSNFSWLSGYIRPLLWFPDIEGRLGYRIPGDILVRFVINSRYCWKRKTPILLSIEVACYTFITSSEAFLAG